MCVCMCILCVCVCVYYVFVYVYTMCVCMCVCLYVLVLNKDLCSPKYYNDSNFPEYDRNILTKYRTGSHYLAIQTGRHTGIPRNERLCKCKKPQMLQHIILECELTKKFRNENYPKDLQTFFSTDPSKTAEYIRHRI